MSETLPNPNIQTFSEPEFAPIAKFDARDGDPEKIEALRSRLEGLFGSSWLGAGDSRRPVILTKQDGFLIVKFNYYKTKDGSHEEDPRTVLVTAMFHGEHPDHRGQGEDDYLHGMQLSLDDEGVPIIPSKFDSTSVKNFARNSILGLAQENLIDANSGTKVPVDKLVDR